MAKKDKELAVAVVVTGLMAGIGAVVLSLFLEVMEQVLLGFHETAAYPAVLGVPPLKRILVLLIAGILAAISWWWVRNRMRSAVSVADAVKGKPMPFGTTLLHTFTQMLFVGAGGSVGRELAPRELAAALAQVIQRQLKRYLNINLSEEDSRLLTAAAAGAGFAGVYIAPITGMLFSVEILLKKVSRRSVVVSLVMSSIATLVGSLLKGFKPYYLVGPESFSVKAVLLVVVLGPLCGLVGGYFRRLVQWAAIRQAQRRPLLWQLPAAALLTAGVATFFPQITGNGRALAQLVYNQNGATMLWWLLMGGVLKMIVTTLTLRAGAAGGTLTPSIAIGATIGLGFGVVVQNWIPGVPLWQFAMLGSASLLAASQQAPLMAMFMLFEVSHLSYSALLPLGIGVSLAIVASQMIYRREPQRVAEQGEPELAELLKAKVDAALQQQKP